MKAGTISIQNMIQTPKALKRIRIRVAPEQVLYLGHSTIGTIQLLKKKGRIYTTLTGRLLRHFFFHFHQYATDAAKLALNALRFRIILSSIGVWGALLKLSSMN